MCARAGSLRKYQLQKSLLVYWLTQGTNPGGKKKTCLVDSFITRLWVLLILKLDLKLIDIKTEVTRFCITK